MKLGSGDISNLYLGPVEVSKAYLGAVEVFGADVSIYGAQDEVAFVGHNSTFVSSSCTLGTAHSDREIWVCVATIMSGTDADTTAVTVGGNSATKVYERNQAGTTQTWSISYWKYVDDGALGTSATIAATHSTEAVHTGYVVFTAKKTSALLDSYGAEAFGSDPTAGSITTQANGWSFFCEVVQNGTTAPVPNFANDGSFDMGTDEWVNYGFNSPETDGTTTVDHTSGTGSNSNMITAISMRPA